MEPLYQKMESLGHYLMDFLRWLWKINPGALSAWATVAAAVFAAVAALIAFRTLSSTREQTRSSALAEQMTYLTTGEIAASRSRLFARSFQAIGEPLRRDPLRYLHLTQEEMDDAFKLMWAIQRMGVLSPVLRDCDAASKAVAYEQIDQIVSTLSILARTRHPDDKGLFEDAVRVTCLALDRLEPALAPEFQAP